MTVSDDRKNKQLQRFRDMAQDRMERISLLWMDIEQGSSEAQVSLLRELHTHKGDASVTGFALVAAVTHALEDAVVAMFGAGTPKAEDGDLYFDTIDLLNDILIKDPGEPSNEADALLASLQARSLAVKATAAKEHAGDSPTSLPASPVGAAPASPASSGTTSLATPAPPSSALASSSSTSSLRVEAGQLNRMREIMGELILARGRMDLSAKRVRRERESAHRDRGSVADSELAHRLEKTLHGLESGLRDDAVHLSDLVDALDELTSDLRMVSITELFERYPRHVRELARSLNKSVGVQIVSQNEARLDREILDALEEPILHLIRNAVDHGIETPEERARVGKNSAGMITLSTRLMGNSIEIRVADDGAGIDLAKVRAKAQEKGLLAHDNGDDRAALQTLLAPGMTTRSTASAISGRGIGLDVVASSLKKLGGSLEIESTPGKGTHFVLTVPLSLAISMVMTFRVGNSTYALPADAIESVVRKDEYEVVQGLAGSSIRYRDLNVPLIHLCDALGESSTIKTGLQTRLMIVRERGQRWALDDGYGHTLREAVLKPASKLLRQGDLITAGCPLDNGDVALMLNIGALHGRSTGRTEVQTNRLTALIADDSPIIRDLLSETLRSFGLEVIESEDGADALLQLDKHGSADILVTDLDMPNIDGIALIKAIRQRPGPRMPAIVISTRGSEADQIAAMQAGADAYLVKTSFTRDGLWSLVSKYLQL